jgi:hypothetical protein
VADQLELGIDRGTPGRNKKRISGSIGELASSGRTGDPVLIGYSLARQINAAAGGTVITPWEVQDLPYEWQEGAAALTTRLEPARKANAVIEQKLAAWRASHPTYKKKM